MMKAVTRFAIALALAVSGGVTAWLLACGPFLDDYKSVRAIGPAHEAAYGRGAIGIVRPRFARRYLVHAYRQLSGRPVVANALDTGPVLDRDASVQTGDWQKALARVPGRAPATDVHTNRQTGQNYQWFTNCPESAFVFATRTLDERIERYGPASAPVREWADAQSTVFLNCSDGPLMLPAAPPATADALTRADRTYQTAAAYFYGMEYEEAGRRFRAIAADPGSPWRIYGGYLAARAAIRMATVREQDAARRNELLGAAEKDLRLILADGSAGPLHASTRGLLDFVAAQLRPVEQFHALSRALASESELRSQQVVDFQVMFDRLVGDTVDYDYGSIPRRDELIEGDDLADWILAIQGEGDGATARALAKWKATRSAPWLVAALWKLPSRHPDASLLLDAASQVPPDSPAYPTVAFLRVRLLTDRGERAQARTLLQTLPPTPDDRFQAESLNLIRAERFRLAASVEELLANAARAIVSEQEPNAWDGEPAASRPTPDPLIDTALDQDAALTFTFKLPLDRVVEAANATTLPPRLARRVAISTFTRAVLLGRHDAALRVLSRLRALAPPLAADLDRFANGASDPDRHIAAIRLLLRTPGMQPALRGQEDSESYRVTDPSRTFDHVFRRNWWCSFDEAAAARQVGFWGQRIETLALVYPDNTVPSPDFLTPDERAAATQEQSAIARLGNAADYLATEAVKWATDRPTDADAAEALAHAVEGARWACDQERDRATARRAFTTLHRLFPSSEWAKKTKYWY